jgi:hypothetical protein
MKKFNIIFFIIIITANFNILAQSNDNNQEIPKLQAPISISTEAPQEIVNRCSIFFKRLMTPEFESAFDLILKDSPIIKEKEKVNNLITQLKKSISIYGVMGGYEAVSSYKVTESLYKLNYITLHTEIPMRWIITFYKSPQKGWIVINIKFDDLSEFFFKD